MTTPNPDIPNIPNSPAVSVEIAAGPARPLVLFPVRLETRFFALADGSSELRVRVYPDNVHVDTHEPALTPEEVSWGQHFWEQTWRAANDEERSKAAWRQLADRFDPQRAAWIAQALKPLNPDDRPPTPVADDQPLSKPVRFPAPPTQPEPWMRAPLTRVLPDSWFLLGYKNGQLIVNVKGGPIRDPLATGPDPSPSAVVDEIGLDKGIKWMVDFNAAEEAGMGVRVKLSKEQASAGLDFLLVFGVRDFPATAADSAARLTELFNAHHYTDGLSFIRPGTPSNNTAATPSGFSSEDPGHETSYQAERLASAVQPGDGSSADLLATALGLEAGVFSNLPHAAAPGQLDARQMNTALWQATWGYFLLQMLGDRDQGESPLTGDDIAWARNHFIEFVRASGPLPAIRAGKQPYGVLPVTSLDLWKPAGQDTRADALRNFLINLRKIWRTHVAQAPRLGRTADVDQARGVDADLTEVMSMEGLSPGYAIRNVMGRHYLEHLWIFLSSNTFVEAWNLPDPAPPPDEDPPELELEPGLTPRERAALIQAHQKALLAFNQRRQRLQTAFQQALARKQAIINGKRDSVAAWWATQERLANATLQRLGVTWLPRLSHAVFAPPIAKLSGPLVQTDQSTSLSPNYIEQLLAARNLETQVKFRNLSIEQPAPHTLLHLLLRHSMLLEYTTAASTYLIKHGLAPQTVRRELELVDLPLGRPMLTPWRQLATKIKVNGQAEPIELGKYLLPDSGDPDVVKEPDFSQIREFRASLNHLKTLTVDQLETLMAGTLDLCSHRLDAWITSIAARRLAEIRKATPNAVLFGGYGWVMNLQPAAAQTKVAVPGETEPAVKLADNPGFTHTPSLSQASTAAILRSAHLSHTAAAQQTQNDLLAIDLSSERVRLADWLLDGVRQGQPLGALLGYRFERRLQEAGLAEFIFPFRELAPLVARKLDQTASPGPVETIAANNVVDGLVLLRRWQNAKSTEPPQWTKDTIPFGQAVGQQQLKLPPPGDPKFDRLQTAFAFLADSVDAVSDALMAEGMYHLVRGNPLRAATTVESIAGGETPPPELEAVRTPRTGIAITHRLLTLFSGNQVLPPEWQASLRARAEPHLNAWAAKLLGNPAKVRCVVERFEPETANVVESKELRLEQLQLAPLDFVYAIEGGPDGQHGEIEGRILYTITRAPGGFAPGTLLRVSRDRKPEWKNDELGYGEFSELLRTVRKLFTGVRGIDDNDLNLPDRSVDAEIDVAELNQRAVAAAQALTDAAKQLAEQLAAPDTVDLESLRASILLAASFGIAGAVPVSAAGNSPADRELLRIQAQSIQKEFEQRSKQLDSLTDIETRDVATARLRAVFGKAFVVLPQFRTVNGTDLKNALGNSTALQASDPLAAITWLQRMARVRAGVSRFNAVLDYAEILKTGEKLNLKVAQLPFATNDRWVGLPLQAGQSMPAGKLSLVVQAADAIDVTQSLAGLLIDEWVEVVPSTTEITGIALQYDQPNSAPPQTILLAVPPEIGSPWTIWSLQQVLLETLDLARIRAVDSEALNEVGHYLPAMYFACNVNGDTVSTDFTTIK